VTGGSQTGVTGVVQDSSLRDFLTLTIKALRWETLAK